ncbi:MAG TPA: pyruvate dehydrogenase (acetyl-transferring), homodimeric type, partial [Rhodanobacteraceae bacterium]
GATAGCSFPGEGLQHSDCTSQLVAGTTPNCKSYDPTFSYEVAVIMHQGVKDMLEDQKDVFYYVTTTNENCSHPDMPEGVYDGIIKGMYLYQAGGKDKKAPRVQLMGAGGSLLSAIKAAEMLKADFGVEADVWSCPSFVELGRDGFDAERWNRLHPEAKKPRVAYVTECLTGHAGPVVAVSEYVRGVVDQVRAFIPAGQSFTALGSDGYGRSDTREALRDFFEVDAGWIAHAALAALAAEGKVEKSAVTKAIKKYGIDQDKPNPLTV